MDTKAILVAILVAVGICIYSAKPTVKPTQQAVVNDAAAFVYVPSAGECTTIIEVNVLRAKRGLPPLRRLNALADAAQKDADRIALSNGSTVGVTSQCVYVGNKWPKQIVKEWGDKVLSPNTKYIGWGFQTIRRITNEDDSTLCVEVIRLQ